MTTDDKYLTHRQKLYESFLDIDLEGLALKSSTLSLYDYLQAFDYPQRTKVKRPEALEICYSFKAAIQAGWTDRVENINGKIGLYWFPPGGKTEDALSPKAISDRFR